MQVLSHFWQNMPIFYENNFHCLHNSLFFYRKTVERPCPPDMPGMTGKYKKGRCRMASA